jgi:peptidoglycan/xylan/chitin deacetylase (PgdA/CDA1 family)
MKRYLLLIIILALCIGCNQQETVINNEMISDEENNASLQMNSSTNETDVIENTDEQVEVEETIDDNQTENTQEETIDDEPVSEEVEEGVVETIDYDALYRQYQVNENGQIMIIMYHNLASKPGSYATTAELFRQDLQRLYNEGYRTISMSDLISGQIDIPIGTTPVLLTFDDGSKSNFFYDEDGEISSESVVGILDDFYNEYPEFGKKAIFYLYGRLPFREYELIEDKLTYLIEQGYEIGTHTYGHQALNELGPDGIRTALGQNEALIDSYIDNHDMIHLSLPYGIRPSEGHWEYVKEGIYESTSYQILSSVNVGWNPIKSPIHMSFNPYSLNRVTVGEDDFELNYWLDYFLDNPSKKFISDGDPNTWVVPSGQIESINETKIDQVTIYNKED